MKGHLLFKRGLPPRRGEAKPKFKSRSSQMQKTERKPSRANGGSLFLYAAASRRRSWDQQSSK
jgi:hypothetical protein